MDQKESRPLAIGDIVRHKSRQLARVEATSGLDNQCIIRFQGGFSTGWIPQEEVTLEENEILNKEQ